MKHLNKLLIILLCLMACKSPKRTTNYYFNSEAGMDSNIGTSPEQAFKSLYKLNDLELKPGDSILLKSGLVFNEPLYFSAKGAEGQPIVISKYGGDKKPHLKGDATYLQMVHIYNSEHVVIRDLEISNKGTEIRPYLSGLLVELYNYGKAKDITIDNLYVHDVYGSLIKGEGHEHKDAGGGQAIMIRNVRGNGPDSILSCFDGLLVQNCMIKNSQRNGIMMWGNWIRKHWFPSTKVVIRNNIIDGVPGDGIVPVGCESPLVEYNIMKNCPLTLPITEACDGIWPWGCDNALIQFNIVSDHKSQVDGYGFDSDYDSRNSHFRYNLSYNNYGGFLLLCNSGGWPEDFSAGNSGTVVEYNISINDGIRSYILENKTAYYSPIIHITGPTKNSIIANNIFYIKKKEKQGMDKRWVSSDDWGGYADSTFFVKNFIYAQEPTLAFDGTKSTNNFFDRNAYVGPLSVPSEGFTEHKGTFGKQIWYDAKDKNWDTLIEFIKDKTVLLDGKEIPVIELIF